MRFKIFSDLHLEFFKNENKIKKFLYKLKDDSVDYYISAGDLTSGNYLKSKYNLIHEVLGDNLVFVAGNHEYYNTSITEGNNFLNTYKGFLNNSFIDIENIRIIGATGWHRFYDLLASKRLNDFRMIKELVVDGEYSEYLQEESFKYFKELMNISKDKKIICLTHNAPIIRCLDEYRVNDRTSVFYANAWDELIASYDPVLWIFGHTHDTVDFKLFNTRIVSNAYGYNTLRQNKEFNYNFIIDI